MLRNSPLSECGEGWTGVNHIDASKLYLFYVYEDRKPVLVNEISERSRRIELLVSKFRSDAAKYADLKFRDVSVIEVVWEDNIALSDRVALPKDFNNGKIVLPPIWLQ